MSVPLESTYPLGEYWAPHIPRGGEQGGNVMAHIVTASKFPSLLRIRLFFDRDI